MYSWLEVKRFQSQQNIKHETSRWCFAGFMGASVASNETVRKPLPFSARWIAPRMLQGLAGQICLPEPLTFSAPILSKPHILRELKSFRNLLFLVCGAENRMEPQCMADMSCDSCRPVVLQLPPWSLKLQRVWLMPFVWDNPVICVI